MKGCILFGRFTFSTEAKNRPPKQPRRPAGTPTVRPPGGKP
jgi:hypothetical protein